MFWSAEYTLILATACYYCQKKLKSNKIVYSATKVKKKRWILVKRMQLHSIVRKRNEKQEKYRFPFTADVRPAWYNNRAVNEPHLVHKGQIFLR